MTGDQDVAGLVGALTEAQRRYFLALPMDNSPYLPRHGRTANWALRHEYTETVIQIGDRVGTWGDFATEEWLTSTTTKILGQRLTATGTLVRERLMVEGR